MDDPNYADPYGVWRVNLQATIVPDRGSRAGLENANARPAQTLA